MWVSFCGYCTGSQQSDTSQPKPFALCALSWQDCLPFQSFFCLSPVPFPPSSPTPDHLINHITWLVFLRCLSHCHFPDTGWVSHRLCSPPVRSSRFVPFPPGLVSSSLFLCCRQTGHLSASPAHQISSHHSWGHLSPYVGLLLYHLQDLYWHQAGDIWRGHVAQHWVPLLPAAL